jgi:hypothetical protein
MNAYKISVVWGHEYDSSPYEWRSPLLSDKNEAIKLVNKIWHGETPAMNFLQMIGYQQKGDPVACDLFVNTPVLEEFDIIPSLPDHFDWLLKNNYGDNVFTKTIPLNLAPSELRGDKQ